MSSNAVLLVDDDRDIRELLAQSLTGVGIAVTTAANGREGLAALRAGVRPAAILLDIMMPVLDGWEFLREVARDPLLAEIPVVTMTASSVEHDRAGAHPSVRARLLKPFSLDEIRRAIEDVAA